MNRDLSLHDFANQVFWIGFYGRMPRFCFQKVLVPNDFEKKYLTIADWFAKISFSLLDYVEGHNPVGSGKTRQDIKFPFIMEDIDQNRYHMVYRRQMSEDLVNDKGEVERKGKAKSYIQGMWAEFRDAHALQVGDIVELFQLLGHKVEGCEHNSIDRFVMLVRRAEPTVPPHRDDEPGPSKVRALRPSKRYKTSSWKRDQVS